MSVLNESVVSFGGTTGEIPFASLDLDLVFGGFLEGEAVFFTFFSGLALGDGEAYLETFLGEAETDPGLLELFNFLAEFDLEFAIVAVICYLSLFIILVLDPLLEFLICCGWSKS